MTRGKTPSPAASLHEQTVRQHCRALKMPTVAGQFETLAQAAIREGHGHVQYLDALLTAEIEERERKGVVRRIQEAHLPRVKTLAEFDFRQSSVSAARIADLAAGGYIERAEPVVLIGEAGTGKTHLALGLCVAACQQRRRVRLWLFLNFCTVASVNLRGTATVIGSALFLYVFITAA
jgi:DNA replication protein DnaC